MVVTIVVVAMVLTGAGFLLAASYMALSVAYSAAIAAAIVGSVLVLVAGLLWLVSEAIANRRRKHGGGILPVAQAAVGAQSGNDAVHQIVGALKQESPLSVLAAAAGILVGLFLHNRR